MKQNPVITIVLAWIMALLPVQLFASTEGGATEESETVDVKEVVFGHIGDAYQWHVTTWGNTHLTIHLPVMVYSSLSGWHCFSSARLEENGGSYEGLSIALSGSPYEGKLVEHDAFGAEGHTPIKWKLWSGRYLS